MNLIRKYKISKILNQSLEGIEGEIVFFIQDWLKDLIPFKMDKYPESIFYTKEDNKWVLEQDNKNDRLWVRYEDFWSVLEDKYSMIYNDIQDIIKYLVEEAFKLKVSTPHRNALKEGLVVEEAFKLKVSTPPIFFKRGRKQVEEAFKLKVSTPIACYSPIFLLVEEAFKLKVSTPFACHTKQLLPP